jgi:hypothetical protein
MDLHGMTLPGGHKELDGQRAGGTGILGIIGMFLTPSLHPMDMRITSVKVGVLAQPLVLAVPVTGFPALGLRTEPLVLYMPVIRRKPFPAMTAYSSMAPTHGSPPGSFE